MVICRLITLTSLKFEWRYTNMKGLFVLKNVLPPLTLLQYRLWSFKRGDTKLNYVLNQELLEFSSP